MRLPAPQPADEFGPLDLLYDAIRCRYPMVTASVVKPGELRGPDQPDTWLVVTHRDEGPSYIGWDDGDGFMWIYNPSRFSMRCPRPAIGTPDQLDQAADAVAREMRVPTAPTEPEDRPRLVIEHTTLKPLTPVDVERNREIIAERLGWPDGVLQVCRDLEARWPGWNVTYAGGRALGGDPEYLAFLDQSKTWRYNPQVSATDPAGLEELIRDADARRPPRPW